MRSMNIHETVFVGGGDAAATRLPGTNSWGQPYPPDGFVYIGDYLVDISIMGMATTMIRGFIK